MYTEQELTGIQSQQKKRWVALAVPEVVLLAGLVASLMVRQERVTVIITLVMGVLMIAGYDLFIKPLRCYEKHLSNVLHGRIHEVECNYARTDEEISLVDGVAYHAMTFTTVDEKNKPYDLLFYYDAEKPLPNIPEGAKVKVTYHDHEVAALSVL